MIALEEAKQYLRIDSADEDALILGFCETAQQMCMDIARIDGTDLENEAPTLVTAQLYAIGYLYEHREEANHKELRLTLRCLLSSERKEVF